MSTRQEIKPFWRVIAFALAAGVGFELYVAVADGEVRPGAVRLAAAFVIVALALGLADRWVWLRPSRLAS